MRRDEISINNKCVIYPDQLCFQIVNPVSVRALQIKFEKEPTFVHSINTNVVKAVSASIRTYNRQNSIHKAKTK